MAMRKPLIAFALLLAVVSVEAFANGDPASHVLPSRDVFLPSDRAVCSAAGRRLEALTEASRKVGYPIKVAVIPTAEDLGTLFRLFGRPDKYARQLAVELPAELFEPEEGKRAYRLLILMPAGLGLEGASPKESRALERIRVAAKTEAELTRLATRVVPRLARAAGSRVGRPRPKAECFEVDSSSSSSSSSPVGTILIIVAPIAMLALALYIGSRGRSRRQG